ncbi:ABC transporter ATP-binding protein [Vreelandella alkaliphila]|uniref:ABC transporter ATP-binding protein n=1 Tax=Halomonadaceae TaxID=28256 RepID=UPI001E2C1260|nr:MULTISPECIES: ABC transporter ATP-binding protein [unclassified Halomonas]MCD6003490.1 ABC transporter ATP-binding protein/permease [Halomonas sp. IOP_6]MCD6437888.1 ABC transporter ATP-binding protein [Halomonas sp.]
MLKQLRELYSLLTQQQRRQLLRLQVLIIGMALAQIAGVIAIGPFMAVVGDMNKLQGDGWLAVAYSVTGMQSPKAFLSLLGAMVLGVLLMAALLSIYTSWRLALYSARVGAELSSRLYRYYLHQPWLFHSNQNTSALTTKVSAEVQRVSLKIINPVMELNAKLIMLSLMTLAIFLYNPLVAIIGVVVFFGTYLLLYQTVRRFLIINGRRISKAQSKRFKLMSEGFGGIKDLLLLHRQTSFTTRFDDACNSIARGEGVTQGLSEAPRYAIELVAFGSVIVLVLYLLNLYEGNLGAILPALSIYALAGFKMLPGFQKIYTSLTKIRGNLAAYNAIRDDLIASRDETKNGDIAINETQSAASITPWVPQQEIKIQDVVFDYPGTRALALDRLTLTIPVNQMVGLVGTSGSGKSTAVDLLLGLIEPQQGQVLIDGVPLTHENLRQWQAGVGFVPQQIFLSDASILENVAFAIERKDIDVERVKESLRMAQLDDLLDRFPEGLETRIGERGVQISGGQRQRLGIARALYQQARVLVFDEATSALDGITERRVMEDIQRFSGQMTVIMIAHRLATVKGCDIIYMLENGQVIDAGTYDDLASRNHTFQMMANL